MTQLADWWPPALAREVAFVATGVVDTVYVTAAGRIYAEVTAILTPAESAGRPHTRTWVDHWTPDRDEHECACVRENDEYRGGIGTVAVAAVEGSWTTAILVPQPAHPPIGVTVDYRLTCDRCHEAWTTQRSYHADPDSYRPLAAPAGKDLP